MTATQIAAACLALTTAVVACATREEERALHVVGSATITYAGSPPVALAENAPLAPDARIVLDDGALAVLVLANGCVVRLDGPLDVVVSGLAARDGAACSATIASQLAEFVRGEELGRAERVAAADVRVRAASDDAVTRNAPEDVDPPAEAKRVTTGTQPSGDKERAAPPTLAPPAETHGPPAAGVVGRKPTSPDEGSGLPSKASRSDGEAGAAVAAAPGKDIDRLKKKGSATPTPAALVERLAAPALAGCVERVRGRTHGKPLRITVMSGRVTRVRFVDGASAPRCLLDGLGVVAGVDDGTYTVTLKAP
jgi:hypothetical protein